MPRPAFPARLFHGLGNAFRGHPLTMACGLGGSICGIAMFHAKGSDHPDLMRALLVLWLGISLTLAADLLTHFAPSESFARRLAIRAAPVPLLLLAWYGLRGFGEDLVFCRMALWAVATHCLVAVSPFLAGRLGAQDDAFQADDVRGFNLVLFEQAVVAVLFTEVLYAGIALAVAAIHPLFKIRVAAEIYPALWFAIVGLFQTAYLANGIPKTSAGWRGAKLNAALAFLPRYILLPLGLLYLVLLYAYAGKAIALAEWPRGWASSLILVYAGIMLLTLLLLDQGGGEAGKIFGRRLTRLLFGALAPLLILLYMSIGKRVAQYGITEDRYIGLALAAWLTAMTAAHLRKGRTLVLALPLSLGLVSLGISFGPWGALSVTERSQAARLERTLAQAGVLSQGRLIRPEKPAPDSLQTEISRQIMWLERRKRTDLLKTWAVGKKDCPACLESWAAWPGGNDFMERLGMAYRPYDILLDPGTALSVGGVKRHARLDMRGWDAVLPLGDFWAAKRVDKRLAGDAEMEISEKDGVLSVAEAGAQVQPDFGVLWTRSQSWVKNGSPRDSLPPESLYVDAALRGRKLRLYFQSVYLDTSRHPPGLVSFEDGLLFIGHPPPRP